MANTESAPDAIAKRDALVKRDVLVKSLKELSLTYEQHQMLHGPGINLLASRINTKRHYLTILLAGLSIFFAILAGGSLYWSGPYVTWFVWCGMCALWCYRTRTKNRSLRNAYRDYVAADISVQAVQPTLADELRFGFNLDYDEYQAIHAGDADSAARNILQRCRSNTHTARKGAMGMSALGLLWIAATIYSDTSIFWGIGMWLLLTCVAALAASAVALVNRATAARCAKLIRKYEQSESSVVLKHDRLQTVDRSLGLDSRPQGRDAL
ncbi:hypothetical protein Poly21_12030 [Allorhodopirellula heiligendammensis]|uniref:Uncharacterized protein n=2 Tax=Allorhodopirellula heiligendammensis TaxID=2714739 RepID=A0A5C6C4L7_9BACT|nr:hypothetical protein Poly21_12030 [Allorhodopirellula heiligendammensis]